MTGFVIASAVIVALVLVLLMRPFFRGIGPRPASHQDLNSAIYREQLAKLEQDLAEGTLAKDDYSQARAELQRRLLDESQAEEAAVKLNPPRKTMVGIALAVPLVAGAFYLMIGSPASMGESGAQQQQQAHMPDSQELERMIANLAARLEKEPDNYQGWAMLARSYKAMGRLAESEKAFERAGSFIDNDPQMLAAYADVIATNNGGTLAGKPAMLIQKALKADPDHPMALWLAGTADVEVKNYGQALRTFERLASLLPPGSDDARMLQGAINDVRAKAGLPAAGAAPAPAPALAAAAAGGKVSGTVELDPSLKGKAGADDTLMVIARLPGTRMPLAVARLRASQFPVQFTLDDAVSMNPQSPISAATDVELEARISKSGLAKAEPGDLISVPQTVKVGAKGVALRVIQVRP